MNSTGVSIVGINEEFNGSTATTSSNASSTSNALSSSTTKSAATQAWRVDTLSFSVTAAVLAMGLSNSL